MKKINLFWALVWSSMALISVAAIFWNPSHYFTLAISAIFAAMFWHDYRQTRGM